MILPDKPKNLPSAKLVNMPMLSSREAYALRALATGEATPDQQKLALHAISQKICRARDAVFIADPYEANYVLGRRSVAVDIADHIELAKIKGIEEFEKRIAKKEGL